ncbi:MAG: hypothetical protein ACLGXA_11965 [Acidobacteriota bacterium]
MQEAAAFAYHPNMPSRTITIPVDQRTEQAWNAADPQERRKAEALVGMWVREVLSEKRRSLDEVLEDAGRKAQARGLTPEILESALKDR